MDIRLGKGHFESAKLSAISSKSYVHRQLIASGCSGIPVKIMTNIISEDMTATAGVLNSMGADVVTEEDGFSVKDKIKEGSYTELDCNESGSTARFIMPLAALMYDRVTVTGKGRLPQRPFKELCEALRANGVEVSDDHLPITMNGRLKGGDFYIPGGISSQYITGLLMSLPLSSKDESRVILTSPLKSAGYVDITLDVLKSFGIRIIREGSTFIVPGGQRYIPSDTTIISEGDWSNGAFLLCIGALSGSVGLKNLNTASFQKDAKVLDVLKAFGADINTGDGIVRISRDELLGVDVDTTDIPDIVPALAVVSSFAKDKSIFRNVKRLKIKESDRLGQIIKIVTDLGADAYVTETEDDLDLVIIPRIRDIDDVVIDGAGDHRIVMCGALIAPMINGSVTIKGAEAVNKSYPGFFDMLREDLKMDVEIADL